MTQRSVGRVIPRPIVFALAWQGGAEPVGERVAKLTAWMSNRAGRRVVPRIALSYMELARMMTSGEADVAWLPPVVFLHLETEDAVLPLARNERDGSATFQAALIVRNDSHIRTLDLLRGARAAWVDRWSASGHVIPRAVLGARGFPAHITFREEKFYGSHEAVVHAVISGRADVGATFARTDERGRVLRGGWSTVKDGERTRVLMTFGTIPGDIIGVRSTLDEASKSIMLEALLAADKDPQMKPLLASIFGVQRFVVAPTDDYDPLRAALRGEKAAQGGA